MSCIHPNKYIIIESILNNWIITYFIILLFLDQLWFSTWYQSFIVTTKKKWFKFSIISFFLFIFSHSTIFYHFDQMTSTIYQILRYNWVLLIKWFMIYLLKFFTPFNHFDVVKNILFSLYFIILWFFICYILL